jgi:uncharacterized membrane protein YkoI
MANGRLIACGLLLLLTAGPSGAGPYQYHGFPFPVAQRGYTHNGGISLDEAVSRVRKNSKDKVLSAETARVDGRKVYRIKILTKDGRVKRKQIDAETGRSAPRGR